MLSEVGIRTGLAGIFLQNVSGLSGVDILQFVIQIESLAIIWV